MDYSMELFEQIKEEMKKVYLADGKPIVLGFSGGKDSSLLLTLLWEMLLELPADKRMKTVHVMNSDTLVEAPVMSEYVDRTLIKIERKAALQGLPIQVHRVRPKMKDRFFYRVLGRGNLIATPKTKHRGCTHWLKITPTQEKLKELIASAPVQFRGEDKTVLTLFLGVRVEESARRAASISSWQLSEESLFAKHSDFEQIMCFHPLKFVDADSLWFYLLDKGTLPFGVSADELAVQYGEGILECGMKTSSDQGQSCGGSGGRLGCWTCGLTSGNDPMLLRYIAEGKTYEGLLAWKNLMLAMRNDLRFREVFPRQRYKQMDRISDKNTNQIDLFDTDESTIYANRFETYRRAEYEQYAPGGMTFEGRKILLEYLLFIQERDGHSLISEDEIQAILDAWEDTEGIRITRSEIQPGDFHYDGQLVFLPNKRVNKKETKNTNKVFYVTVELNKEENELYRFFKNRQKHNRTSIFFFPDCQEFKDKKLVWNKATFVVCKEGITTQLDAAEYVYKWLGWAYGSFTEETNAAAINFLILSALSEGFREQNKKLNHADETVAHFPVINSEDGQLAFAI
jgi:DNA sulfur modification protein DndC